FCKSGVVAECHGPGFFLRGWAIRDRVRHLQTPSLRRKNRGKAGMSKKTTRSVSGRVVDWQSP
ncbi:MAG: hypothetical protein VB861_10885, partial [Planctomycetaceae bacterium]